MQHKIVTIRASRWVIALAVICLLAGAGGLFFYRQRTDSSVGSAGLRKLIAAVGKRRFTEARLTGGFAYGPLILPKPSKQDQELRARNARGSSETSPEIDTLLISGNGHSVS